MTDSTTGNFVLRKKFADHVFYLVFDIATIVTELFLFEKLTASWETLWIPTYIWAFLLFCLGIFLKRWDNEYLYGIAKFGDKYIIVSGISVYFFGLGLGAFALFSLASFFPGGKPPIFIAIPAALIFVFGYPVLFAFISKTKTGRTGKLPVAVLYIFRLVSYFSVFLLNMYCLSFVYNQLDKFRSQNEFPLWTYPIVLIVAGLLVLLFYLPARIHLFFQTPDKRGNYISFFITCAGIAVFAVTGIHFGF